MPRRGHLEIKVLEASHLKKGDIFTSDPFVNLKIRGLHRSKKTEIEHNTANPKWNQELLLKTSNPNDVINLKVMNYERFGFNHTLGNAQIPVGKYLLNPGSLFNEYIPLRKRSFLFGSKKTKGIVHMMFTYKPSLGHQLP